MTIKRIMSPEKPGHKPEKDIEKQRERQRSPEIDVGRNSGKQDKPKRVDRKTMW